MSRDRYAQCDGTCTTDCGACKGNGRPVTLQEAACQWAHGPVAELDSRGLCPVCAEDDDVTEGGAR